MPSDDTNFDPAASDLTEDVAPSEESLSEESAPETLMADDPTAGPEHDTSPEALEALLQAEEEADVSTEASLPSVKWAPDNVHPDFAHAQTAAANSLDLEETFTFDHRVFELLARANRYKPAGKNGLVAFGIRGGTLVGDDRQEGVDSIRVTDARPNHADFRCTLGIFDTNTRKIRAYEGSTVPNKKWMTNYYKIKNGIRPHSSTRSNLLPTACYIYRVNAHSGGKIKPALRMTDPDNLKADAVCTVLRTHNDLTYTVDDLWDRSTPYDNIHCAYSNNNFSSAGCQTIKGPNGQGPWGAFQKVIGGLGWDARIDYMLVTGRDAAIAAAIVAEGRENDDALVQETLGRLRVGSHGEAVTALQKKLGFNGSGYFGPSTKKRLVEAEAAHGLACDGVYSPADDRVTGWGVFGTAAAPAVPVPRAEDAPAAPSPAAPASTTTTTHTTGPAADGTSGAVAFHASPKDGAVRIAGAASLSVGGSEVPIKVDATITGLPDTGLGLMLTVAGVPLTTVSETVTTTAASTTAPAAPAAPTVVTPAPEGDGPKLTAETFDSYAPRARADYRQAFLTLGHSVLGRHGVDANGRRLTHFLAQMSHESGGFSHRVESLNYTTARQLTKTWPSRFPTEQAAQPFVRNEEALAEKVYGGRMGNTRAGDGFRYRGRGLIQLTGRKNYREYAERLGVDLEGNPDLAFDPETALRIAVEYWAHRKLPGERTMNALADDDKLRAITYRINGGFTNFAHREQELARAKAIWGDDGPQGGPEIVDRGDFSDPVRKLQLSLVTLGRLGGDVDGKFGYNTYKALFKFKNALGMDGAGYADAATFAALENSDFTESVEAEGTDDLPQIGNDPEPIREGISLSQDALTG